MSNPPKSRRALLEAALAGVAMTALPVAGGNAQAASNVSGTPAARDGDIGRLLPAVSNIVGNALKRYHLKAIIARVTLNGRAVYTRALGESMSGVPAAPEMHFRNGAMAFTYMSTLLLVLVDKHLVSLDDPLSKWMPKLPFADRIKLKNLANMTSGYADYVYQPEVLQGTTRDPFRQWSSEELIQIGIAKPMIFDPGTNWGYSHTNYVILGRVLEMVTHMDLASALRQHVFEPMGLKETRNSGTPQIPEPVMHSYSSERRGDLGIDPDMPFYEESTFWNPSWTTAEGAVETTDIADFAKSMEAVGTGKLLSRQSFRAQVGPNLVGFGHEDPKCSVCRTLIKEFNYGLGVVNLGPWVTQSKSFAGNDAMTGYLAPKKVAIAVVTTYTPAAFDKMGNHTNTSLAIFTSIGNLLAPNSIVVTEH